MKEETKDKLLDAWPYISIAIGVLVWVGAHEPFLGGVFIGHGLACLAAK